MPETWFAILCFMLVVYVILDGWNIGAGVLHLALARDREERREVIAAIGPLWSWHEVWLVAAGGTFVLAFPSILATAFAGYYLALWCLLWCLILRGVSIEVAGHIADPLWQKSWDFVFCVSSVALAILFGAALGNVIRGVPLDTSGKFSLALFTDFGTSGEVGILDWYTLVVALFALVVLAAHGATYIELKTRGPINRRARGLSGSLWLAACGLFPAITVATAFVRPTLFSVMLTRPVAWLFILVTAAAAVALLRGHRKGNEKVAFAGSCLVIGGLLGAFGAAVFPTMLHSTVDPTLSMTAYNGSSSRFSLAFGLVWWPLALALAIGYFVFVVRHYTEKVGRG